MRDGSGWFFAVLLIGSSSACGATPAVTVVRPSEGGKIEQIRGDNVKLRRSSDEGAYAGARSGFHVIRSASDWKSAWKEGLAPPMPPSLDTRRQMAILAVGPKRAARVRVERAVETAEMLYFYVKEMRPGRGCVHKPAERPYDAVLTERVDKPAKFFVAEEEAESCGEGPSTHVECTLRTPGAKDAKWATTIAAQPGDTVECVFSAGARGKYTLIDKGLGLTDLPPGSSAKLSFRKGPDRPEFDVDVYGTYTVTAEAAAEDGRRGRSSATIEVTPPKTKDVLVQLVWTGFAIKDVQDTFPRANLRVAEEAKGQRCSADVPVPGLCEVKTRGAYTYMRIPAGARKLPVSVEYLDAKAADAPSPCVHVWFDGTRTGETCDRAARSADEVWRVGVLDTTTGKIDGAPSPPSR